MFWSSENSKMLPAATGPFVPGCLDIMLGYEIGGIFFRLYYPTSAPKDAENSSEKRHRWIPMDNNVLLGIAKVLTLPYYLLRLAFWWSGNPLAPVLYGEKVRTENNMKCIIFSHGLGGCRCIYSKISYDLASQGYLVACLEHRDNSSSYTYCYESKEHAKNDIRTNIEFEHIPYGDNHLKRRQEQIRSRTDECLKVMDFFKKLNDGIISKNILDDLPNNKKEEFELSDLVDKIDVNNFTVMGHSFGAASALATFSESPDVKQCIALDAWMFPIKDDELHEKVTEKAILFINTQTFHITTNIKALAKFMASEKAEMYTIRQTTHEHQTDSVLIFGSWLNMFMRKIDAHEGLKINNALIVKFLHEHIGLPKNVQEYKHYLDAKSEYLEKGLTKPWR